MKLAKDLFASKKFIGLLIGFCLSVFLLTFSGCAFLDEVFGVDPETGGRIPGDSPVEEVGGIADIFFPWASTAIAAVAGIYSDVRRRQYLKALSSVARGVNVLREQKNPEGKIILSEDSIKQVLEGIQKSDKTQKTVDKVLTKLDKA